VKYSFLDRFLPILAEMRRENRRYIICSDVNIAHREIDIHDPTRCSALSGFLPEERRWLDAVVDEIGWVDAFRHADPREKQYSWWSNRAGAFDKNLGWRIDYQLISPPLQARVRRAEIVRDPRFSDHAPLIVDYDL
jgi:exodeoxyribonuclease-3